jgi:hypothetical protein
MMRARARASNSAVIARLDRATQYAAAYRVNRKDPRIRGDDEGRAGMTDACGMTSCDGNDELWELTQC